MFSSTWARRFSEGLRNLLNGTGKTNLVLMGLPGAGKTSIGRVLSEHLKAPVYDVDDDHLEDVWGCSVADKLKDVGDVGFLEAEGQATQKIDKNDTIISLTGSNPLYPAAMEHIQKSGYIVFLDVAHEEILARMERMKVTRIVGQATTSLKDILEYRSGKYDTWYNKRLVISSGESVENIAQSLMDAMNNVSSGYQSTRDSQVNESLENVILSGLAKDAGLYVPKQFPGKIQLEELGKLVDLSFNQRQFRIIEKFPLGDLHQSQLASMVESAYQSFPDPEVAPVTHLKGDMYLIEQFHGPTASFKDLALQLTPKLLKWANSRQTERCKLGLLVATSGDTGSAALDGFSLQEDIPSVVLFPKNGVSSVQKKQMQCARGNNLVMEVDSDFDFCQTTVKKLFLDPEFNQVLREQHQVYVSAGNSLNWGRLIPQVGYSVSAYCEMVKNGRINLGDPVDICVPTGNFGNILGVYYAKKYMGLPVRNIICASNVNNVLNDFFHTGHYDISKRSLVISDSPAMDILVSSNLERFLLSALGGTGAASGLVRDLYTRLQEQRKFSLSNNESWKEIQGQILSDWCPPDETLKTMGRVLRDQSTLIDPHTAVGVSVAERLRQDSTPVLVASTAHWSKFPEALDKVLGLDMGEKGENISPNTILSALDPAVAKANPIHPEVLKLEEQKTIHDQECPADYETIRSKIFDFFKSQSR